MTHRSNRSSNDSSRARRRVCHFPPLEEPKPLSGIRPKSATREVSRRLHSPPPEGRSKCASQPLGATEVAFGLRIFRSSSRFAVGAEAPREPAWGSESLPPTIAPPTPRRRRCRVRPLMQASGYGPGARHATGKLMAPPLGFFVLSAFFSLGNRAAPVCLSGTLRSQGFSPSQRFSPARALRLCFAPHPPIGFLVFRAFPTQSAVAPLDARCSFVVSSSSGSVGFPLPSLLPQPFIARQDRLQPSPALRIMCAPQRTSRHHLPCDGPKPIGRVRAVTPLVEVDAQRLAARFNVWSAA